MEIIVGIFNEKMILRLKWKIRGVKKKNYL